MNNSWFVLRPALLPLLLLCGCQQLSPSAPQADLPVTSPSVDARQLHAQGLLAAALAAAATEPGFPEVLREAWRAEALALENDALLRAEQAWKKADRSAALAVLDAALMALPESVNLARRRYGYQELLERRLLGLRAERTRTDARYLLDTERLERAMATVLAPDSASARERERQQDRRQALSQQLLEDAGRLGERRQWSAARDSANLAKQLGLEHGEADAMLKRLQGDEARNRDARADDDSEAQVLADRKRQLLEAFQLARKEQRLGDARATLTILNGLFPQEAAALALALAPQLREQGRSLQREADAAYQRGEIARALQLWQEALGLDPDNLELPVLIRRAQTVLSNLQRSQKPAVR